MKFTKKTMGHNIVLKIEQLRSYGRWALFNVYKLEPNGNYTYLYKEGYDFEQLKRIASNNYTLEEEVFS